MINFKKGLKIANITILTSKHNFSGIQVGLTNGINSPLIRPEKIHNTDNNGALQNRQIDVKSANIPNLERINEI